MKKSELKKIILEALTPDEATKVDSKYKEIYSGMLKGKSPLKLKNYDNPDAMVLGRTIKLVQKESKLKEVYSEKQRKWACAQDDPKFDEMCKDTAISKKKTMENTRLQELIKSALMGPINETLDDKVYDLVDRMLDAMGGSDNLLEELIRAMSTDDAMLYLSAIARDHGMLDDAEEISEKKKDHDGDGDIDSDDYMIARDKAIKKAKAKANESLAERILKELRG